MHVVSSKHGIRALRSTTRITRVRCALDNEPKVRQIDAAIPASKQVDSPFGGIDAHLVAPSHTRAVAREPVALARVEIGQ